MFRQFNLQNSRTCTSNQSKTINNLTFTFIFVQDDEVESTNKSAMTILKIQIRAHKEQTKQQSEDKRKSLVIRLTIRINLVFREPSIPPWLGKNWLLKSEPTNLFHYKTSTTKLLLNFDMKMSYDLCYTAQGCCNFSLQGFLLRVP